MKDSRKYRIVQTNKTNLLGEVESTWEIERLYWVVWVRYLFRSYSKWKDGNVSLKTSRCLFASLGSAKAALALIKSGIKETYKSNTIVAVWDYDMELMYVNISQPIRGSVTKYCLYGSIKSAKDDIDRSSYTVSHEIINV